MCDLEPLALSLAVYFFFGHTHSCFHASLSLPVLMKKPIIKTK